MKYKLLLLILSIGIISGMVAFKNDNEIKITNGDLEIQIDDKMRMKIAPPFQDAPSLMDDFTVSEYLETRYFTAKEFDLQSHKKRTIKDEAGEGTEWQISGVYRDYPLEKIVKITTYKDYPGMAYFKVKYVNKGDKDLPLKRWVNNNYDVEPSKDAETKFWSFQGSTHADRRDWIQKVDPGHFHRNFMGMNETDYGGGIPVVDLWRKEAGGIMIGMTDSVARLVSLPVVYDQYASHANINVNYAFADSDVLKKGANLETYQTFVGVHDGDCFKPLATYAQFMKTKGVQEADMEPDAYESMWCAWGYERGFTLDEIIKTLPKVKEMGIKWVGLDDGFSQDYGDWHTNKEKFPGGDAQMKAFVDTIHSYGLKAMLWWNPVAIGPRSNYLQEFPNSILRQKDESPEYITWWDSFLMAPTDSANLAFIEETTRMFIEDWGYDGLKLDGQNQNFCYPDYGRNHNIFDPDQAFERLPHLFKVIFNTAREINPNAAIEICPCGTVYNFYNMPYANQFVSSDPLSSWQVRTRALVYHALMPQTAYYGDHVELIDDDFASQIGVGAVPGTKFVWPELGSAKEDRLLLTPSKEKTFKRWIDLYNEMELSKGTYRGDLYDVGYNFPETHCIEKDGKMYYAVYNEDFNGSVKLKGLDSSKTYAVRDYFHDTSYGNIQGANPDLTVDFRDFLVLEVKPL